MNEHYPLPIRFGQNPDLLHWLELKAKEQNEPLSTFIKSLLNVIREDETIQILVFLKLKK